MPGPGSGLSGSLGMAAESAYGTYVAPTKWVEVRSAPLQFQPTFVQGSGLAGGRMGNLASRRVRTTVTGSGTLSLEVPNKGLGLLLQALMGTTVTPVQQATTAAYLQTHTLANPFGKSLTMQVGKPDRPGTVRPYTFLGATITAGTFEGDVAGLLMASFDVDARDMTEAQALVTPTYPASTAPYGGASFGVKLGAYGAEAAVQGITKAAVKVDRNTKVDSYTSINAGYKSPPVANAVNTVTCTLDSEFFDKTILADRFAANPQVPFSLIVEWIGPVIASTYFETFRIRMPQCQIDADSTNLDGPDVLNGSFPIVALEGAQPMASIEYLSTDVVL